MYVAIAVLMVSVVFGAFAQSSDNARTIMERVDEAQYAETSMTKMSMHIYDSINSSDSRDYHIQSLSRKGDKESFMEFIAPRSIKGMKILTLDEEVRIYFPSTGRVRRITGSSKSGSVGGLGGDFSYEDMSGGDRVEDYRFSLLSETGALWKIEAIPSDEDISYSKVVFHIDKQKLLPVKIEYFTEDDGHTKTMSADRIEQVSGRYTAMLITMKNHEEQKKTVIKVHEVQFGVNPPERYFNPTRFYK
jgi:hypothetical protein